MTKEQKLADALLEAVYDFSYRDNTNITKEAALDAMRRGILPSY